MSRSSAAKKARRKKRVGARNEGWLPDDVHADVEGVARIANEIVPRGWEFDHEFSSAEFITWYYPPSAIEDADQFDGPQEPVTRIWLNDPEEPHVILVGGADETADTAFTVEELFARLGEIEAHRWDAASPD